MSDITTRLAQPFDPAIVSWRVGPTSGDKTKGMALAYIDARDVMRRLDEVCGPENWQDDYPWSDGKRVVCRIGIRIGDEWVWKTDGAGDTDTEGEKGALSDAFKRAAVKWSIGRYLYDVKSPWVAIEQKGKSYVIKESEYTRLAGTLPKPQRVQAAAVLSERSPQHATASETTPFDDPAPQQARPTRPVAVPQSNMQSTTRDRIKALIEKYKGIIVTAPSSHALSLSFDDGRDELNEIEAFGENGKLAAVELRDRFMRRMQQFTEGRAA